MTLIGLLVPLLGLLEGHAFAQTTTTTTTEPPPPPPPASSTTTSTTTTSTTTTTTTTAPPPVAPPPPPPPPTAPPPKDPVVYKFEKQELVKLAVWKANVALGFSATTGNANVIALTGSGDVSRNDGWNKIALHVEGNYGVTNTPTIIDSNMNGVADNGEYINNVSKTTAAYFQTKLRYDRFVTNNNALFIAVLAGLDLPASRQAFAAGQIGYSRHILQTKMHDLTAELGYDFAYDRLIVPDDPPPGFLTDIFLHNGRIFVGYVLTVSAHTAIKASAEALINFNSVHIGDLDYGPAMASRFIGKVEITTKIWKPLAFRAGFTARYNNAPALTTAFKFALDFPDRYNQTLDTLTDLGFVLTFL